MEELDETLAAARADMQESLAGLKKMKALIGGKKELQRHLLNYICTKPACGGVRPQNCRPESTLQLTEPQMTRYRRQA